MKNYMNSDPDFGSDQGFASQLEPLAFRNVGVYKGSDPFAWHKPVAGRTFSEPHEIMWDDALAQKIAGKSDEEVLTALGMGPEHRSFGGDSFHNLILMPNGLHVSVIYLSNRAGNAPCEIAVWNSNTDKTVAPLLKIDGLKTRGFEGMKAGGATIPTARIPDGHLAEILHDLSTVGLHQVREQTRQHNRQVKKWEGVDF